MNGDLTVKLPEGALNVRVGAILKAENIPIGGKIEHIVSVKEDFNG